MKNLSEDHLKNLDGAIVAEPTELQVCYGTNGSLIGKIFVKGEESHVGSSKKVLDPVDSLYTIRNEMKKLAENKSYRIGLGMLKAGSWIAGNPKNAEQGFELSYPADEKNENQSVWQNKVYNELESIFKDKDYAKLKIHRHLPSSYVDKNSEFVKKAHQISKASGYNANTCIFPAWCDSYHLVSAGINTIVLGPGSLDQAHKTNEYVSKKQLIDACEIYTKLISE